MKRTFQPKKKKRAATHGFRVRNKSRSGRKVMKRRMRRGRAKLAA